MSISGPLTARYGKGVNTTADDGAVVICVTGGVTHTLTSEGADAGEDGTGRGTPIITQEVGVRRLTPLECERLQGFPDNWTAGQSDAQRYRQMGNAVAVPVVEWIARRLVAIPDEVARRGEF